MSQYVKVVLVLELPRIPRRFHFDEDRGKTCYAASTQDILSGSCCKMCNNCESFHLFNTSPNGDGIKSVTETSRTLAVIYNNTGDKLIAHRFLGVYLKA